MTRWILGAALAAVALVGSYRWVGHSPEGDSATASPAAEPAAQFVAAARDERAVAPLSRPAGESPRVAEAKPMGVAHLVDTMGRPLAGTTIQTAHDGVASERLVVFDGSFPVASEGRSALRLPPDWDVVSVDGQTPEPASVAELPRAWLVHRDAVVVAASLGDVELTFVDLVVPGTLRSGAVHLSAGTGAPPRSFPVVDSKASIRAPSGGYDVFVELAGTLPQVLERGQRLPVVRGVPQQAEILVLSETEEAIGLTLGNGVPFVGSVDVAFLLRGIAPFPTRRFDVAGELRLSRVDLRGGKGIASLAQRESESSSVLQRVTRLQADAEIRTFVWTDGASLDLSPTDLLAVSLDSAKLPWKELRSASLRGWGEPESAAGIAAVQDGSLWHWRDVVAGPYLLALRHPNGHWNYETPVVLVGDGQATPVDVTDQVGWEEALHTWSFAPEPGPSWIESIPFASRAARGRRLFGTTESPTGFPVFVPKAEAMSLGGEIAAGMLPSAVETQPGVHTFSSSVVRVRCETGDGRAFGNARVWVQSGNAEVVQRADFRGELLVANCAPDVNLWLLGPGDVPIGDMRLRAPKDGEPTSRGAARERVATERAATERVATLRAVRTARVVVADTGDFRRGELVRLHLQSVPGTRVEGLLPLPATFERWLESPGSVALHEVPEGEYVLSVAPARGQGREERRVHIAAGDLVRVSLSDSKP
ncbi:MAG: hypothetical protein GC161_15630 [Planctomycetaceae bacterium]|nr:hypothetical protein [Planctomycetaceae bacterium]